MPPPKWVLGQNKDKIYGQATNFGKNSTSRQLVYYERDMVIRLINVVSISYVCSWIIVNSDEGK